MTTRSFFNGIAAGSLTTLALAFGAVGAQAASIVLGNTGVGTYTVAGPTGASTSIVPNGAYPIGAWFENDTTSSWIGAVSAPAGNYTYSTVFNLTELLASTATISGNWAVDNNGVSILLNGSANGIFTNAGDANYTGFTAFTIDTTANFLPEENTLSFIIENVRNSEPDPDNPVGLRVAMTGTANTKEIPEPSDLVGTVFAVGSVVLLKRKFGKTKTAAK